MYFYYYSSQYLTTHEPRHVQPPFVRLQYRVGRARTPHRRYRLALKPYLDRTAPGLEGSTHRPRRAAHAACPLPHSPYTD